MNYQKYTDKAFSKIKQYGSSITITHSGQKHYSSTTNTYTDDGTKIYGVALQSNYQQRDIDGTNIRIGDIKFMASLNGKPQTNDTIEFEGKNYTVINVSVLSLDGKSDIFYTIQAR